jgi:perosamine synthetase
MNPVYELVPIKSDKTTWNIDLSDLDKKLCKNDCVLIVHNVGGVINVPKLKKKYPDCVFIEDNCEGIFGQYDNKMTGTESFCSAFSFFGNKTITSGEGGLFYCQDERITKEVKKIHGQGLSKERYVHDVLGFNYRMTNLQAAILLGQLDIADLILERKNEIWNYYNNVFSKFKGQLQLQHQEENCINANWIYPIMLKNRCAKHLIEFLKNNGVDSRPMFYPMSSHFHLKKFSKPSEEEPAKTINKRVIMIPSFPDITEEELKKVTDCISSFLQQESGEK